MKGPKLSWLFGTLLLLSALNTVAHAQTDINIKRVEPPSWWLGFIDTSLQLMIYGDNIASLKLKINYPGVTIERIVHSDNPNYIFAYLKLDPQRVKPGQFALAFYSNTSYSEEVLTWRYTLYPKNTDPKHAQGFGPEDVIYLITPDRFANGDPDNDNIANYGDQVDRTALQGRHGGDLAGIEQNLDYIKDMGFTALWLNPVLENAMPEYSYHGYAITDYYRVDPRYGSNQQYQQLVHLAKAKGLGVIMDMITNHSGIAHWWMRDLPSSDWINHSKKPKFTSHQRTVNQDPYAADADKQEMNDGWFVAVMPDLNQKNTLLADYLTQNTLWWIEYLGLSGIRLDTYPYPDKNYMSQWGKAVMREYPNFNIVGEEWSINPLVVAYWQRGSVNADGYVSYLPSMMDFPSQKNLVDALIGAEEQYNSAWDQLYQTRVNDNLYPQPLELVIFGDNHDMDRLYTQLNEDYGLYKLALSYLLTSRGVPQVYYGTEILMANSASSDHGAIRADFPGGWHGDKASGFDGKGLRQQQRTAQKWLRTLLHWRKNSAVIHRGHTTHFAPKKGVYVYFRHFKKDHNNHNNLADKANPVAADNSAVMVVLNKNEKNIKLNLNRFQEVLNPYQKAKNIFNQREYALSKDLTVTARDAFILELITTQ